MSTTIVWAKKDTWYKKLIKWLINLAWGALVPVWLAYWYRAFLLSHKRWLAIVILSLLLMFLARVIVAIKRFHERTVDELKKRHGSELATLKTQREADLIVSNQRVGIAESLSSSVTVIQEWFNCDPQSRQPLNKERLEAWLEGVAENIRIWSVYGWLGADAAKEFFDGSNAGEPPPNSREGQLKWKGKYNGKLRMLIAKQYFQPPDPDPLTVEEEEARKKLRDSACSWVAETQPKRS